MAAEIPLDPSRVHFLGRVSYDDYLRVLQVSRVHVYLTVPFVLGWSAMEALSAGCLVVGSDTAPVREVIEDGRNGLLADLNAPASIAERIVEALRHPERYEQMRARARETILGRYDLPTTLPLLQGVLDGRTD
jgi:glycosyltransferase involved in cell wall biosynthesis